MPPTREVLEMRRAFLVDILQNERKYEAEFLQHPEMMVLAYLLKATGGDVDAAAGVAEFPDTPGMHRRLERFQRSQEVIANGADPTTFARDEDAARVAVIPVVTVQLRQRLVQDIMMNQKAYTARIPFDPELGQVMLLIRHHGEVIERSAPSSTSKEVLMHAIATAVATDVSFPNTRHMRKKLKQQQQGRSAHVSASSDSDSSSTDSDSIAAIPAETVHMRQRLVQDLMMNQQAYAQRIGFDPALVHVMRLVDQHAAAIERRTQRVDSSGMKAVITEIAAAVAKDPKFPDSPEMRTKLEHFQHEGAAIADTLENRVLFVRDVLKNKRAYLARPGHDQELLLIIYLIRKHRQPKDVVGRTRTRAVATAIATAVAVDAEFPTSPSMRHKLYLAQVHGVGTDRSSSSDSSPSSDSSMDASTDSKQSTDSQ